MDIVLEDEKRRKTAAAEILCPHAKSALRTCGVVTQWPYFKGPDVAAAVLDMKGESPNPILKAVLRSTMFTRHIQPQVLDWNEKCSKFATFWTVFADSSFKKFRNWQESVCALLDSLRGQTEPEVGRRRLCRGGHWQRWLVGASCDERLGDSLRSGPCWARTRHATEGPGGEQDDVHG